MHQNTTSEKRFRGGEGEPFKGLFPILAECQRDETLMFWFVQNALSELAASTVRMFSNFRSYDERSAYRS